MKQKQKLDLRTKKILIALGVGIALVFLFVVFMNSEDDPVNSSSLAVPVSTEVESPTGQENLPWDYRVVEGKVGDLIGDDMTILPDNDMLTNDDNYATGDQVWIVQFMSAEMTTRDDLRNDIHLSKWESIKSYRTKEAADTDIRDLKVNITTDVDLVGVYKTELDGKFRQFAIVKLPSGHVIKQPIDEARYTNFKDKKQVKVTLEEVHDFAKYDLAMAKFRGWAD
ncbi:signal peptide protein [Paenibacillus sp. KN14-4R]|uniref:signal peptide protein n=1 Tax=Paenibacillus sp. KN14-4R TaxID=3445773 RepID=UPI003FA0FEBB